MNVSVKGRRPDPGADSERVKGDWGGQSWLSLDAVPVAQVNVSGVLNLLDASMLIGRLDICRLVQSTVSNLGVIAALAVGGRACA